MRHILIVGILAVLVGCTSLPKQTAMLSVTLGRQIAEAKRSHLQLIEEWAHQRRERADTLLHYALVPKAIKAFLKKPRVKQDLEDIVCAEGGEMDRALVIQDVIEAISKQTERMRKKFFKAINAEKRALKDHVRNHYAETERMQRAITANVQSAVKGLELERAIRKAMARPLKDIAPVRKASDKLDKLFNQGD